MRDNLHATCGEAGAAHALIMLVHTLEQAKPGDRIMVVGFGQGADALHVPGHAGCRQAAHRASPSPGHLKRRKEETSYGRFLAFNNLVEIEKGMRGDVDKHTAMSSVWRNREHC